jgi:hypothetical protein
MALNFNVEPYYDDFDPNKNFHRILFKPGFAVQARELTQSQTILQNQISQFASHIFQKNTPVSGAKVTLNLNADYIKISTTINGSIVDITKFDGVLIQNSVGNVIARVLAVSEESGGDPPTLVVSYLSGEKFEDDDVIYSVDNFNLQCQAISLNSIGQSSVASISEGVFFVINGFDQSQITNATYSIGNFVNVIPQTIILEKYATTPSLRVGLNITETIYDYINDTSLLDPAEGSPNYQGPGADRFVVILDLETRPLTLGDDDGFIEVMRLENGQILKQMDGTVYSTIDEYFAKRTYDTNGDYVVNDFKLTPSANTQNNNNYDLKVGKGLAYVHGYRLENQSDFTITSPRSRTTKSVNNDPTLIQYGNYFYVDSANGIPDSSSMPSIDLHIVPSANINTFATLANSATYNSTLIGTAKLRAIEFNQLGGTSSEVSKYVYKAFLTDITNTTLSSNVRVASSSSNVALFDITGKFSTVNDAYVGVVLTVDSGTSAGDVRKVTAYNPTTKTLTVDTPFTITLDTTSTTTLRFAVKDVESLMKINPSNYKIAANANINVQSKDNGISTGNTVLEQITSNPELVYQIGYPYVANTSDTSYQTTYVFTNESFGATSASLELGAGPFAFLSSDPSDYIIVNQATGAIGSIANVSSITLSGDQKTASFVIAASSDLSNITATVSTKVFITQANNTSYILRAKNLYTANTGIANTTGTKITLSGASTANGNVYVSLDDSQVWLQSNAITSISTGQLLYISDVKRIVKIVDSLVKNVKPTTAMISDSSYDVSSYYTLDNGQRDSYYGHASIKLIPGRPSPRGDLLVLLDYYDHSSSQGDGYFSVDSYFSPVSAKPESYANLPSYTAKNGTTYSLRDCLDFRPAVTNAQTTFVLDKKNTFSYIPVNGSVFTADYSYYLARKDKLILSKDNNFEIIQGTPSETPLLPIEPDGSLVIANLSHDPYTAYVPSEAPRGVLSNLSIEKVKHKRWTMQDISNMENRVNNIEYYTALNALEKNAQSLQIPDVNGLNRFKNGILVDDFSSFATADTNNLDFSASINRREKKLSAAHDVDNFPLQSSYLISANNRLNNASANTLGFKVNSIGQTNIFTLPYTIANLASQTLASNTVNINPFAVAIFQGVMSLNPPMDNWVDNTKLPDLLIVDPNLQIYQSSNTLNILQSGDWKPIPGTTVTSTQSNVNTTQHGRTVTQTTSTTTQTYGSLAQTTTLGYYDKLGSTYNNQNGYITDISILPYIRPQQLLFRAKGMLINTPLSAWFDGVDVNKYIITPDVIELEDVRGIFKEDDIIGYYQTSTFYPIGTVASVYNYPGTSNTRLSIVGNMHTSIYEELPISRLSNSTWNSSGAYQGNTAYGSVTSQKIINIHRSGFASTVGGAFQDATNALVQYYRVNVGHGNFAMKYAIWGKPDATGNLPAGTFNYTVPETGVYTLRLSTDDDKTGNVKINGVTKWTSSIQSGGYNDFSLSLSAGTSNIFFQMTNTDDDGDAYFAAQIFKTSNPTQVLFSTDNLPYDTTIPTNVGSVVRLPGGGVYYVGATQLGLSGLANNTSNTYYAGASIKLNSTYVAYNPVTDQRVITPSTYTANVISYIAANNTVILNTPVNVSMGINSYAAGDITSSYSLDGQFTSYKLASSNTIGGLSSLSTDENGSFTGVFNLPANTFKNGERVFKVDNRLINTDPTSATTFSEATFTASGLSTSSQSLNFASSIDSAKNTFNRTSTLTNQLINSSTSVTSRSWNVDPVAQTFIIDNANYPNGAFLNSIKVFFRTKPTTTSSPVNLSIVGTLNGYPNGETLDNSNVTLTADQVKVSETPHHLDANTYTEFVFSAPVYIQSGTLYAFILRSPSNQYNAFLGSQNQIAVPSSVKNLPTDPTPTVISKIGTAPYVGGLFESQNGITWQVDQSKSLMFVIERCKFDTSVNPKLPFVVPRNLPYRKLTGQDIRTFYDANNISNIFNIVPGQDVLSHAYNLTTTDFVPSLSRIDYTYKSTKASDLTYTTETSVSPGKYGCPTYDDIYLNDSQGERILIANSNSSFVLYASLSSSDDKVSPIISDDGLSLYNVQWRINNLELSNNSVTVLSGGTGYDPANTVVTISTPGDPNGVQAIATANVVANVIQNLIFTEPGSGYLTTPTITISDPNRGGNSNVSIVVNGETDPTGGNALAKYVTKKVVLTPANDSGDLRVFYTAYRPKGSNIYVYYKILNRNDSQTFEDSSWQLMTTVTGSSNYSTSRDNLIEFECAPGVNNVADDVISYTSSTGITYTSFSQFAVKIVFATNDNTSVPFLTDLRALALPSGTGL